MSAGGLIDKLSEVLSDNRMDTSAGLHFLGELVKDAFTYIDEQRAADEAKEDQLRSFSIRLGNVESALNSFLKRRETEQAKAEDERKFYRRAVIGGILAIVINELVRWLIQ